MTTTFTAGGGGPLDMLKTLLDSASSLLAELMRDVPLGRVARIFALLPAADREGILSILEREAQARATTDATAEITGLSLRLNPGARLYTRVLADAPHPTSERSIVAALRAIRVIHGALAPMNEEWKAVARAALDRVAPAERASMARLARDILALVDESDDARRTAAAG